MKEALIAKRDEGALAFLATKPLAAEERKELLEVIEDMKETLKAVIGPEYPWTLEQERAGNKAIVLQTLETTDAKLKSLGVEI